MSDWAGALISDRPTVIGDDPCWRVGPVRLRQSPGGRAVVTGGRLSCEYLSDTLTVLCDGNVTCGLDDPNGTRSFGNIKLSSVDAIWRDLRYGERKQRLAEGHSCDGCSLHHVVQGAMPERVSAPRRLIVEATVTCNLRCKNDACSKNNDPSEQTRASRFLPLDVFKSLLDQTASGVEFMWFLNYGEPFLHPQAEDMIAYAKQKNPGMRIVSSTNGIPFARPGRAEKLARSGVDHMTFTIAGIDQPTYVRYHGRGSAGAALDGLRRVCEAKRELGLSTPVVQWRYLLFHWNDSAETIAKVKALAAEMGVDELRFYLTHIPAGGATRRLAFGSPDHPRSLISPLHHMACGPMTMGCSSARTRSTWARTGGARRRPACDSTCRGASRRWRSRDLLRPLRPASS